MASSSPALGWIWKNWVAVIVGLLLLILVIVAGARSGPSSTSTAEPSRSVSTAASSEIGTIGYTELPRQARTTLDLIAKGGPYPYQQDGQTFRNRERLLPAGTTYQEFTVETPGSDDRGARRIIKARDGTLYYTDDHYESFRRIRR